MQHKITKSLLYPCNIVTGVRLVMLVLAGVTIYLYTYMGWTLDTRLRWGIAIQLFVCALLLDVVDGYLARKFGHVTEFGALFDQVIDLLSHTVVWTLSELSIAPTIIAIEWTAGLLAAAITTKSPHHWKNRLVDEGGLFVRSYFQNGGYNFLNIYGNLAHFVFPISIFIAGSITLIGYVAVVGVLIYEAVTVLMILSFTKFVLAESQHRNK
ncbi:MAG: CDP-alcohol phosphatidyltransferase family protein [Chloroflexota bacterium]